MTSSLRPYLQTITVRNVDDLLPYWTALVGEGGCRQRTLWLGVLDEDDHPTPVIIPIDDVPRDPDPSDLEALGTVLASVAEFGMPVLLLSRPGPDDVQEQDRHWARAVASLAPGWPLYLATTDRAGRGRLRPISVTTD